ncbi:MAG: hypothetical protein E6Q24_12180 [Chitinophagaceae bacterium]|nr:MAG: hypothetical protein E6Q24_12180 [Chitinophagaceae bacterium]
MKKLFLLIAVFFAVQGYGQSVFGYWYGYGNVKIKSSASNYLVEMILQPEKGYVKGVLNYYFKNTYRSVQVKGNYNASTRELNLYNIPVTYFGSNSNMEIDCIMNLRASLRAAKAGSNLVGAFVGLPENRYTCFDINFNLSLNEDASQKDSVLRAIREYKETYQVWTPSASDTLQAVTIQQRKVVNYVVEDEFKKRESVLASEIEVNSDSIKVDFYDNGEIDGDSISVFFNNQLLAFSQRLSTRSIHFNLALDTTKEVNELSMFADNLGSIPPNTALMIVSDGEKQYEIRLSSSLEKNATIRIRRKRK